MILALPVASPCSDTLARPERKPCLLRPRSSAASQRPRSPRAQAPADDAICTSVGRALERTLNFVLPGQGMNNFIQMHSGRLGRQRGTVGIQQGEVGDHAEGVGNGQNPLLQLHPIPGHAGRVAGRRITPNRLATAGADAVAKIQHAGSQMRQVQPGRRAGLPQYRWPSTNDPRWGHDMGRVDDGSFQGDRMNRSVARLCGLAICKTCQGAGDTRMGERWKLATGG